MKVFVIDRKRGNYSWGDNYRCVVVAEDAAHAERKARLEVEDWKRAKLDPPIEITLDKEQIISIQNTGG